MVTWIPGIGSTSMSAALTRLDWLSAKAQANHRVRRTHLPATRSSEAWLRHAIAKAKRAPALVAGALSGLDEPGASPRALLHNAAVDQVIPAQAVPAATRF